jgi:hypothetical protein
MTMSNGPLVQIPTAGQDRPRWTKVGIIAAIGFIVGVVWPRLAGVKLGPSVPDSASASASASASSGPGEPVPSSPPQPPPTLPATAVTPAPSATAPVVVTPPAPAPAAPSVNVTVGHGHVFACRASDGETLKGAECGPLPGVDSAVMSRLRKLGECPQAAGASGKLHLVVHLDFPHGGAGVELGRGQSVGAPDALLACAKASLAGMGLGGISHENPRYSVSYSVTFAQSGGAAAASESGGAPRAVESPGEGTAQVVWEVAIVRDAPKSGKVIARLQRGTEVRVGSAKDGWYPVKYGEGFASDGWLYRGAIGR